MATTLLERFPEHPDSWNRVASTWIERAEYERRHGLDPRTSLAQARHWLAQGVARGLDPISFQGTRGNLELIMGQHAVRLGESGEADFRQAIEAFQRNHALRPNSDTYLITAAEAAAWWVEGSLQTGCNPATALARARELLSQERTGRPDYYYRSMVEGLVDLRAACVAEAQGRDPGPDWARAEAHLRASLQGTGLTPPATCLMEVCARRYVRDQRAADRHEVHRLADQVFGWDPPNAEAHLWLAVVEAAAGRGKGPDAETARRRAAQERDQALRLDANLIGLARRLGL